MSSAPGRTESTARAPARTGPGGIPTRRAVRNETGTYEVPEDVDPVALLLAEREEDDR